MNARTPPRLANPSTASAAHSDAPKDAARDPDTLPQAIEAEQQLLGAILLNNETYDRIATLNPSHFHAPVHAHIFERIARGCRLFAVLQVVNSSNSATTPSVIAPSSPRRWQPAQP
ncbi:MAG: hypothetical protein GDA40_12400 [Rhodobacteraceae bacterium]|nr:hypothetical protein [Paracoccaceae bacterium]